MRRYVFPILAVGLVLGADEAKDDQVKKELDKLQGSWTVVSAEFDGKTDETRKNVQVTFKGNTFTAKVKDQAIAATIVLDPGQKPKWIDKVYTEGPDKARSALGIYALEGDELRICQGRVGDDKRPDELASKPGTGQLYVVMKRDKAAAPAPKPVVPVFVDKNLEAAVRAVLHEPKAELNDGNLVNVYILEATGKNIGSLKGLERCKNLSLLRIDKNQVSDLSPLKDLQNLQSLDLAGNKVSDIAPLAGLTKLQYLELSRNQVGNVAPLSGLTALSALYLSVNKIIDLGPLGNLSRLSSLSLAGNQIRELSPLAKVTRLNVLDLNDNAVSDLAPLMRQTDLRLLLLERNQISDLTPLVEMAKKDAEGDKRFAPFLRLYLAGNPLSDGAKSQQLSALKAVGVRVESQ